jgi:hypothetical protein
MRASPKLRGVALVDDVLGLRELHFAEVHGGVLAIDDELDLRSLVVRRARGVAPGRLGGLERLDAERAPDQSRAA